jgi:hypothetical protein
LSWLSCCVVMRTCGLRFELRHVTNRVCGRPLLQQLVAVNPQAATTLEQLSDVNKQLRVSLLLLPALSNSLSDREPPF